MGRTCSTYGRDEFIQDFDWETLGKNHSEDISVDGKIILEWILGK
jgi:hypothetical protein